MIEKNKQKNKMFLVDYSVRFCRILLYFIVEYHAMYGNSGQVYTAYNFRLGKEVNVNEN